MISQPSCGHRISWAGLINRQLRANAKVAAHLAAEQLATSTAYADHSLGWDTWNGWPGTYGHQRRVARRGPDGGLITAIRPIVGNDSAHVYR